MGMLLCLPGVAQDTASGVINATLINKSGLMLVFISDPAGVTLNGSGTNAANLDFGHVSMFAPAPPGASVVRGSNSFTVSSGFYLDVEQAGGSASFQLSAALDAPSPIFGVAVDGVSLTTQPVIVNGSGPYGKTPHTLAVTIPASAVAGALNITIDFVATAN